MEGREQTTIPVRLCCGQRHLGPECPDGFVMCCLCFNRVKKDQLNRLPNGILENVCKPCAELERAASAQMQDLAKDVFNQEGGGSCSHSNTPNN